jgi:hypothetical protein
VDRFHASRSGCLHAFAGPLDNQTTFKLGQSAEDVKYQLAPRRRGVDFLGQRAEVNPALLEVLNHSDKVAQAAGEPVEFPDREAVAVFEAVEATGEERRFVVAPVRRSVKIFLHPARCNAFSCMSGFCSMLDMRA